LKTGRPQPTAAAAAQAAGNWARCRRAGGVGEPRERGRALDWQLGKNGLGCWVLGWWVGWAEGCDVMRGGGWVDGPGKKGTHKLGARVPEAGVGASHCYVAGRQGRLAGWKATLTGGSAPVPAI